MVVGLVWRYYVCSRVQCCGCFKILVFTPVAKLYM